MTQTELMKYVDERCESAKNVDSGYTSAVHKESSDRIDTNIGGLDDIGAIISDLSQAVADLGEQLSALAEKEAK